ncbi:MAG: alpha-L-fucosidase [Bacteroidales bacterium]|nr:alpha-L-fucosidase [Bacteroidales bacterium]
MKKLLILISTVLFAFNLDAQENFSIIINTENEPVAAGKFEPTWESLSQYQVPEWYRNAKFGIWAHWGPQCQPGQGDWYARSMYNEGSHAYKWHVANYGHPSKFGFKDVINEWEADKWDPEQLVKLYKRAGAQYFFAMANHHDNLDMWNSKYQEWNTVRVGPKKNILAGWSKAAKNNGLPFGLSVHAAHAWSWMEVAQRSDKNGEMAGVPYDGKLTKKDGKGTWWEGLDPQELYAQNHPFSEGSSEDINRIHSQWNWGNGVAMPSQEYCEKFYNRTIDLINQFKPDLLYFDDTALPLYPISDAGLKIAAHFYNSNIAKHKGNLEAVLLGKILTPEQKKCLVWDVERGAPDKIQAEPWQTCTCIGEWHYKHSIYENNRYKSARTVILSLIDVVSKNGNMLLSIPIRGDGTIDDKEMAVLEGIAEWMDINKESIFDTRPWKVFGEGPAADAANPINAQGFNEGRIKFTAKDIRFNQNGNVIYVTVMGEPTENIHVKNLNNQIKIKKIELLGSKEKVEWNQTSEALEIKKPASVPNTIATVYKVTCPNKVLQEQDKPKHWQNTFYQVGTRI